MRFKPMQFDNSDATIRQTHRGYTFQFSPSACTVSFSQKRQNANLVADGYDFDIGNITNDLEVHQEPLYPAIVLWTRGLTARVTRWWVGRENAALSEPA